MCLADEGIKENDFGRISRLLCLGTVLDQNRTVLRHRSFFVLNIQTILQTKDFKPQTKLLKWQDRAYQIWKAFNLSRKELPNLFRFFKYHYEQDLGKIEQAYSYTFDYEGNIPKLKIFYWQFQILRLRPKQSPTGMSNG